MARTPSERPAEPDTRAAIVDECRRALKKLGATSGLISSTGNHDRDVLYEVLRKHGAKSDLLKVIKCWQEATDDQWVLNELRRWNTRAH